METGQFVFWSVGEGGGVALGDDVTIHGNLLCA